MGDYSRERYTGISPPRKGRSRSPAYRRDDRGISEERYEPANSLYVAGLSPRVTEQELLAHFEREGKVTECRLVTDPRTHDSRGFGFITMAEVEDAEACIKYLHRSTLEGRVIIVERAKRRRARTPTPGKYLGVRRPEDPPREGYGGRSGGPGFGGGGYGGGGGRSHGGTRYADERDDYRGARPPSEYDGYQGSGRDRSPVYDQYRRTDRRSRSPRARSPYRGGPGGRY